MSEIILFDQEKIKQDILSSDQDEQKDNQEQKSIISRKDKSKTDKKCLIQYLQYMFHDMEDQKLKNQVTIIKNILSNQSNQSQFASKKSVKLLISQMHSNYEKRISQKFSNIFKECDQYANNLKILNIQHSKHHEVVNIQIQLSFYKTKISILNQTKESLLHKEAEIKNFGSFGSVYFLSISNQKYAVKCLSFVQKNSETAIKENIKIFKEVLKQYFFLLLFSTLQIGPKIKKIYGFDILVSSECIQFSTQICLNIQLNQKHEKQLKNNLRIMHLMKIVHRDIKPFNIMYSSSFKKAVFIDFGGTKFVKQSIGNKSLASFYGTTGFSSPEVIQLIGKSQNYVDLYYNDYFGLIKSISEQLKIKISEYQMSESFSYVVENSLKTVNLPQIIVCQIKFCLYNKFYEDFKQYWHLLKQRLDNQNQQIQQSLLSFFIELKPDDFLCKLYWKIFTDEIRNRPQFKELSKIFTSKQTKILIFWKLFPLKIEEFQVISNFYQMNELMQKEIAQEEKKLHLVLIDKRLSEDYLLNVITNELQDSRIQLNNCFLVAANYCSFFQNMFNASIEEKLKVANMALSIIQKCQSYNPNSANLVFTCPLSQMITLARLFQFFIIQIWHQLPQLIKEKSMINSVGSLMLFGYPTQITEAKRFCAYYFIKGTQSKIDKIIYFWTLYLMFVSYGYTFYDKTEQNFIIKLSLQDRIRIVQIQKDLTDSGNQDISLDKKSFCKLNQIFYIKIFLNFRTFIRSQFQQLNKILQSVKCEEYNVSKQKFNKWKYLIDLVLVQVSMIANLQNKCVETHIEKTQLASYDWGCLPIMNPVQMINRLNFRFQIQTEEFLQLFDQIVNYEPLSIRFLTSLRIDYFYQSENIQKLEKCILILLSIKRYSQINLQNIWESIFSFKKCFQKQINAIHMYSNKSYVDIFCFNRVLQRATQLLDDFFENYLQNIFQACLLQQTQFSQLTPSEIICIKMQSYDAMKVAYLLRYNIDEIIFILHSFEQNIQNYNQLKPLSYRQIQKAQYGQRLKQVSQIQQSLGPVKSKFDKFKNQVLQKSDLFKLFVINAAKINNLVPFWWSGEDMNNNFTQYFQNLYGKNFIEDFNNKDNCNPPSQLLLRIYILNCIEESKYSNWSYNMLIQFYKIHKKSKFSSHIFHQNFNTSHLFNAYVFCQKSFQQIEQLLQQLTELLKEYPTNKHFKQFQFNFRQRITCACQHCYPKPPPVSWKPLQFAEYLSENISSKILNQDCYFALIYYFCLLSRQVPLKIKYKLINFVRKSMNYLCHTAKVIILKNIYIIYFDMWVNILKQNIAQNQAVKHDFLKGFLTKNLIPQSFFRKQIYLFEKHIRNQQNQNTLQNLVKMRFEKNKKNLRSWNPPYHAQQAFSNKLRKYHLVKQNYLSNQKIDYSVNLFNFQ